MRLSINKRSISKKGQIVFWGLFFSVILASFISYSLYNGEGMLKKIKIQNIADSSAYSGAVAEAKILNSIAALNQGISFINNLITKIVLVWLMLRVCASFCFFGIGCECVPPLNLFEKYAKKLLEKLKDLSWAMADIQDKILNYGKHFVLLEVEKIVRENGADYALLYPFNTTGNIENASTLTFYLKRAGDDSDFSQSSMSKEAIKLTQGKSDSLKSCYTKKWGKSEYQKAYAYYYYHNFTNNIAWEYSNASGAILSFDNPKGENYFQNAKTTECRKVSSILTGGFKLPSPLIPRDDFGKRQRLLACISFKPLKNIPKFIDHTLDSRPFYALSQAKPFGTSLFEMDWSAKLEKISLYKEFSKNSNSITNLFGLSNIEPISRLLTY